jgi:hypothetical protein
VADDGIAGISPGAGGQDNSALNIGADLAAESVIVPDYFRTYFRALMLETFRATPDEYVEWMSDRIAVNGIPVSVTQLQGFTGFVPQVATPVATTENISAGSYQDLATPGPSFTGLSDGQWLLVWAATASAITGAQVHYMSPSINGSTPTDANAAIGPQTGSSVLLINWITVTLANGSNDIKLQYKMTTGVTGSFRNRIAFAIKYAND